jgi:hypothetical protein
MQWLWGRVAVPKDDSASQDLHVLVSSMLMNERMMQDCDLELKDQTAWDPHFDISGR